MSFEPVTRWVLRCDGDTTHGQCTHHFLYCDEPDAPHEATAWWTAVYDTPVLTAAIHTELHGSGWLAHRSDRLLCPDHVAALDYLARAAVDGLPFPDTAHDDAGPR